MFVTLRIILKNIIKGVILSFLSMLIGDNVTFKGLYLISFLGFLVILVKICEIDVRDTTHHFEEYY